MKLSEPKVITYIIAVVLALVALLGTFITLPFISANAFLVLFIAFVLLALANLINGL